MRSLFRVSLLVLALAGFVALPAPGRAEPAPESAHIPANAPVSNGPGNGPRSGTWRQRTGADGVRRGPRGAGRRSRSGNAPADTPDTTAPGNAPAANAPAPAGNAPPEGPPVDAITPPVAPAPAAGPADTGVANGPAANAPAGNAPAAVPAGSAASNAPGAPATGSPSAANAPGGVVVPAPVAATAPGATPATIVTPGTPAAVSVTESAPPAARRSSPAAATPKVASKTAAPIISFRYGLTAPGWDALFRREPLGFSLRTPARAYQDLRDWLNRLRAHPEAVTQPIAALPQLFWLRLGFLLLLVGLLYGAERVRPARWRLFWARVRGPLRQVGRAGRFVRVLRRAAVPGVGLLVWLLGDLLLGPVEGASALVQGWLAIWAVYRVATGLLWEWTREVRSGSARGRGLARAVASTARFAACWTAIWLLLGITEARPGITALWASAGHLVLVLSLFGILARKAEIFSLLPRLDNPAYRRVVLALQNGYAFLLYGSLVVALLWVIGYQQLAALLLGRSWALLVLLIGAFALYQAMRRALEARLAEDDTEQEEVRQRLLVATERLLAVVTGVMALAGALQVLGLAEAWEHLLAQVWIRFGEVHITGRALWSAIVTCVAVTLLSEWVRALLMYRVYPRLGINRGEAYALNRLLHYTLLCIAGVLVFHSLGISAQSMAIVLGGASVGIGFGLQSIANNVASGLILLTSRQVRKGDIITVGDVAGAVAEVNLRSTVVTTGDNVDLIIPNSQLLNGTLTNWTHSSSLVRVKLPLTVSYASDPLVVREIGLAVAARHPDVVAAPAPEVWFKKLGDNGLDFELLVWLDFHASVRPRVTSDLYFDLLQELRTRGVETPYPQRDLHLKSGVPWPELLAALNQLGKANAAAIAENGRGEPSEPPETRIPSASLPHR